MERDTFIFRKKWYEAIKSLDDRTKASAFDCICQYALYHNTAEATEPMVRMAMAFIIPELEADCDKWLDIKEKRSEAGKKGNEKRWGSKESQEFANIANASKESQEFANIAVYDNVNVNVSKDNILLSSTNVSESNSSSSTEADAGICYKDLISFWNKAFENTCIRKLSSINGNRKTLTIARVKEYGKDKFAEAIRKAASSKFITSGEFRNFDYDWFVRPNNFPKVLEGKYNDGEVAETKSIPTEYYIDLNDARNRYYEGDRSLVWVGSDPKHMSITTKSVAEKYGLSYKLFAV